MLSANCCSLHPESFSELLLIFSKQLARPPYALPAQPRPHCPAPSTLSAWASRDFKLLVTIFSSSSRSPHLLQGCVPGWRVKAQGGGTVGVAQWGGGWEGGRRKQKGREVRVRAVSLEATTPPPAPDSCCRREAAAGDAELSRDARWEKVPLPRKAQRGYYLLLGGYQRLEGLVHGSKLLLQLPGSAGGSRHRSEGKACPCGLWPGELPDQCAQYPTQSPRLLYCSLRTPRAALPLGHLRSLF